VAAGEPLNPEVFEQVRHAWGSTVRDGDAASRDGDGYLTYVARTDDVFKASDYRISPFELESVLIERRGCGRRTSVPRSG
jgi:acetyl-CoA synthetase